MLDKVGEEFEGMISSVTSFGMFIELENTVEGLIRLSAMTDDYYHFHDQHMALIGERTSKVFRIGDEVKIRVARVNMEEHTIDFEMVDMKPRGERPGGFGGGRGGKGGRPASGGGRGGAKGGPGGFERFTWRQRRLIRCWSQPWWQINGRETAKVDVGVAVEQRVQAQAQAIGGYAGKGGGKPKGERRAGDAGGSTGRGKGAVSFGFGSGKGGYSSTSGGSDSSSTGGQGSGLNSGSGRGEGSFKSGKGGGKGGKGGSGRKNTSPSGVFIGECNSWWRSGRRSTTTQAEEEQRCSW